MSVLESSQYAATRKALQADPIIEALAADIFGALTRGDLHGSYTSSWEFTSAASNEYHRRGGKIATHIGGPAEAIKALIDAWGNDLAELHAGTQ